MAETALLSYLSSLQKSLLPGVAARGLALARGGAVALEREAPDELRLRVKAQPGSSTAWVVTLWPGDEDQHCECEEQADPCTHIAAACSALRLGLVQSGGPELRYVLELLGNELKLIRYVGSEPVTGLRSAQVAPSELDLKIERAIEAGAGLLALLPLLKELPGLEYEGRSLSVGPPIQGLSVEVVDESGGYRIRAIQDPWILSVHPPGLALCASQIRPVVDPGLDRREQEMLQGAGRYFSASEGASLVKEVLPSLEAKLEVTIKSARLPVARREKPYIQIRLDEEGEGRLSVVAQISYSSELAIPDPEAEAELKRWLQMELQLAPANRIFVEGLRAVDFTSKLQAFAGDPSGRLKLLGKGSEAFRLESALTPDLDFGIDTSDQGPSVGLSFKTPSGERLPGSSVLLAFEQGSTHVRLLGGGFAPLPLDWLRRFAGPLSRLLAMQQAGGGRLPRYFSSELAIIGEELGVEVPDPLRRIREMACGFEGIRPAKLPRDLTANLRGYQRQGVDWLCFVRDAGMGAMLADDMGLGKTLQALCAIRGRTLVVAPTSVLEAWQQQVARFRPSLRVCVYYGPMRRMDESADLTLTSYGVLRQEVELLASMAWETVVLDEAQVIKNPDSQTARAAHRLRAGFRIALSGTPVENRIEDLWSQFEFLNPGLLGSREEFRSMGVGDRLRSRVRPFILRRMKRDVASELPPKTEMVLHSELSQGERDLYSSLLASSRREVLEALEQGGSLMGALELLLRLRQAACHPALVPGQMAGSSSKLDLLAESLESSLALGHRALVFSQWTSFLDLIAKRLGELGIAYLRIDGSTEDRGALVDAFQSEDGPPVMLLSLKAGGVGITLTRADQVYLMDSWWNPAVEEQAADRAYRIGQKNPVTVYRLISRGTVEEKILELQKSKLLLSQEVMGSGGGDAGTGLSRDDLVALLEY